MLKIQMMIFNFLNFDFFYFIFITISIKIIYYQQNVVNSKNFEELMRYF